MSLHGSRVAGNGEGGSAEDGLARILPYAICSPAHGADRRRRSQHASAAMRWQAHQPVAFGGEGVCQALLFERSLRQAASKSTNLSANDSDDQGSGLQSQLEMESRFRRYVLRAGNEGGMAEQNNHNLGKARIAPNSTATRSIIP